MVSLKLALLAALVGEVRAERAHDRMGLDGPSDRALNARFSVFTARVDGTTPDPRWLLRGRAATGERLAFEELRACKRIDSMRRIRESRRCHGRSSSRGVSLCGPPTGLAHFFSLCVRRSLTTHTHTHKKNQQPRSAWPAPSTRSARRARSSEFCLWRR